MVIIEEPILFQWDKGNQDKSLIKHGISNGECEEAFLDLHKVAVDDLTHSKGEVRHMLFGMTRVMRLLTIVFTVRDSSVRVISARSSNKKEHNLYNDYEKED